MLIKHQLMLISLLVIMSMVFIIMFTYEQTSKILVNKNKEYTSDIILQLRDSMDLNGSQINKIITSTAYDGVVQQYLTEDDYLKRVNLSENLDNLFRNIIQLREGILDIVILGKHDIFYSMSGSTFFVKQYNDLFMSSKNPYYTGIVSLNTGTYEDKKSIIVGMAVYSTNPNIVVENNIGTIAIILDSDIFDSSIEKIRNVSNMKFYLLDRSYNIYHSNDTEEQISWINILKNNSMQLNTQSIVTIDGEKNILQSEPINSIEGTIVSIMPENRLLGEIIDLRKKVMLIFLISLLLIAIPAIFTVNNILLPIKKFLIFISGIKLGEIKNFEKRISIEGYSEMSILANKFNQMLDEIEVLTHTLIETNSVLFRTELEKKQAELNFLESQINPHFLYNTLESIKALALISGTKEIHDMTKALGRILRYGVNASDEVTVMEELNVVKDYLYIQQVRFKDRIDVYFDISPSTLKCIVPKMILQPVVENAIFHGLEPSMKKGSLFVSSEIVSEHTLVISIKDNGVGMSSELLEVIRKRLLNFNKDNPLNVKVGIGVSNVNNRIKLKWGNDFGLTIRSEQDIGTEAVLRIPVRSDAHV
ncbi:sensor histidine kinase [Paenibacillus sp. NRS-1760]|uniref:sensor histidine kinase n=1 Tax=Paenibacillus sp. NRS-1760 TaxID=3233902 RepID=UPI003D298F60